MPVIYFDHWGALRYGAMLRARATYGEDFDLLELHDEFEPTECEWVERGG
jgi:hypothetical protein